MLEDLPVLIKKWLELVPEFLEKFNIESEACRRLMLDGLDFIKSYADKFHHAKEEDILFDYTDKNLDIIKTIFQDHETARGKVKAMSEALKNRDRKAIVENLSAYRDILTEHIKKEDEILYPWIDRGLSMRQVGELFARFNEADGRMNKEVLDRCEKFALEVGERVQKMETKKEESK